MKRILSVLLVLSILLTMLPVYASAEVLEGDCGDTCNWSLDTETGVLYIQGVGEIEYQYSGTLQPWYPYRDSITEVVIADGITTIPRYTFEYLSKARTIRLPDTLEYLACNAFNNCEALNDLVIPASVVEFLNTDNFNRCTALTDIWYVGTRAQWEQIKGYANAEYYEAHTIHCLTLHEDSLTCPTHGKQPYYAYDGTSNTARYDADLNRISCDTCGLASSGTCGENAFWSFNEATGRLTIRGTGAMTDYTYSDPAPWSALPVKAVTVEEGITTIGHEAFQYQAALTQVLLPEGLTSLGYCAFRQCRSLANIKLPDTLTTIFPSALEFTALYTVHIPASVAYIGEYAFLECPSLQYIYFEGDVPVCLQCDVTSLDNLMTGHVSQIFYGCKATVYYPVHNETWTQEVRDAFCQANNGTYTQLSFTGNHEWSDATCTEAQACTVCGLVLGEPLGHRGSWTTLSQPTCQRTGEKQFVCSVCGHTETEIIPIVDHKPVDLPAVAPTCTKPGKTAGKECDFCGLDLEGLEEVPATGHTGTWTTLSQPTCQRTGEKRFLCSVCGHTETEVLPIVDHNPVDLPAVAPTCTKPGKTAGQECDFCGLDLEGLEEVPATGHQTVTESAVAPTCTQSGLTEGSYCGICGEVFAKQEVVPATGHTEGDPITENRVEPTCTAAGSYQSVTCCSVCGKELSRRTVLLEKLPHEEVTVAGQAPTCTENGLTEGKQCTICGQMTAARQPISAVGHTDADRNYRCDTCGEKLCTDHQVEVLSGYAPTCTETGLTDGTRCGICGEVLSAQQTLAALGHTPETVRGQDASCTRDGLTESSRCMICGTVLVEPTVIPAKGHTIVTDPTVPATCTAAGLTAGSHCGSCGEVLLARQTVPAKGHHRVPMAGKDADCFENGLTEGAYCDVCDEVLLKQEIILSPGHTTITDPAKEPTCTEPGLTEGFHCPVCGETMIRQEEIPAKGHTEQTVAGKDATCTEPGLTDGRICTVCGETTAKQEVIPAMGHRAGASQIMNRVEATCTREGSYQIVLSCADCGIEISRETVTLEKLAHKEVVHAGFSPTCTEAGLTEGRSCAVCGTVFAAQTEIPATGHSDSDRNFLCDVCGEKLCTDHQAVPVEGVAPTCTKTGLTEGSKCGICGEVLTIRQTVPATGHTPETIPGQTPTCTEAGFTEGRKCSVCDETLTEQSILPATGHTPQTDPGRAPTCTEAGLTEGSSCAVCGEILIKRGSIPATGHTNKTLPAAAATCTAAGLSEGKQCTVCGVITVKQEVIPARGHTEQVLVGQAATCTEPGLTDGSKCVVCGEITVRQQTVSALGHTDADKNSFCDRCGMKQACAVHTLTAIPGTEATCTKDGLTEGKKCTVCGTVTVKQEVIPATGHSFGGWEAAANPGEEQRVCKHCGLTETRSASSLRFALSSESAFPGDTVTVTLTLENNPGIIGARLALHYDADKLELIGLKDQGLLKGGQFGNDLSANPFMLVWEDPLATRNNTANGAVLALTFRLRKDFSDGTAEIRLSAQEKDVYDKDIVPVDFTVQSGSVTIRGYEVGDVNRDSKISLMDATYLRRNLAGWKNYDVRVTEADTNGDGEVSLADATVLRRYLAGWKGYVPGQPAPNALQLQEDVRTGLFRCSDVTGQAGDTVTVEVLMEDNPGIIGALLSIGYDPQKLQLTAAEDTGLLAGHLFGNDLTAQPYNLSWEDPLCDRDNTANGAIARLTFTILEDCLPGETEVTVSFEPSNVYNFDLNPTPFLTQAGTVTVEKETIPAVIEPVQIEEKKVTLHIESKKELTSVQIWCAVYDSFGQFVDVVLKEVTIPAGSSEQTVDLPDGLKAEQWIRAFLLDDSHAPCSEAVDNKD